MMLSAPRRWFSPNHIPEVWPLPYKHDDNFDGNEKNNDEFHAMRRRLEQDC